jgi:hypothetical protein
LEGKGDKNKKKGGMMWKREVKGYLSNTTEDLEKGRSDDDKEEEAEDDGGDLGLILLLLLLLLLWKKKKKKWERKRVRDQAL